MTAMVGLLARLHALGSAVPVVVGLFVMLPCTSHAQEPAYTLAIRDHRFEPSEIDIPAGKKVALVVRNLDPTPEQFDSTQLRRENVVRGGQEITIYIGPLRPGRYEFFGHFNPKTARGQIIVK
jgi:Cupredoxin-like domain